MMIAIGFVLLAFLAGTLHENQTRQHDGKVIFAFLLLCVFAVAAMIVGK
jgi:biotin transporter BioY